MAHRARQELRTQRQRNRAGEISWGSCYTRTPRHFHRQEKEEGEGRASRHIEEKREKDRERLCLGVFFPLICLKVTDTLRVLSFNI